MSLSAKTCTPCRGGVEPMGPADAENMRKEVPEWSLTHQATRLERKFKFSDFATANRFVDRVGELAEEQGHHPDITFGWGYATVEIWTHKIGGLHENDFIFAAKTDAIYAGF
ncbi:MAG: 4a-hydroxytetrahydrobiopterin dehydratase [Ectothiorhodospiraceae bacterium]|nr:4a-hydroxytetrahydrobiopterin dehydratase [Ectothiorhodospiraceae bacterium]MCH8505794.1 4a-hydroxytetrahydrobiopterin dehydratase [Ectothiorhodospiraceae bacterium]